MRRNKLRYDSENSHHGVDETTLTSLKAVLHEPTRRAFTSAHYVGPSATSVIDSSIVHVVRPLMQYQWHFKRIMTLSESDSAVNAVILYDGASTSCFRGLHCATDKRLPQLVRITSKQLCRVDKRAFRLTDHSTATCTSRQTTSVHQNAAKNHECVGLTTKQRAMDDHDTT